MKFRALTSAKSGAWQLLPAAGTMLISLAVVRWHSELLWGSFVPLLVIQQALTVLLAWGNKEFIQRKAAENPGEVGGVFTRLLLERSSLLLIVVVALIMLDPLNAGLLIAIMVLGQFLRQSLDVLVLLDRKFERAMAIEALIIALQLGSLWLADAVQVLWIIAMGPLLKGLLLLALCRKYVSAINPEPQMMAAAGFLLLATAGFAATKADLLVMSSILVDQPKSLAAYQVLTAMVWMVQGVAAYLTSPYVPHVLRLNSLATKRFQRRLLITGLVAATAGIMVVMVFFQGLYQFQVDVRVWPLAWLLCLSSFLLTPLVYQCYKQKMEQRLAIHIAFNAALLVITMFLWHHWFGMTILIAFLMVCLFKYLLIGFLKIDLRRVS